MGELMDRFMAEVAERKRRRELGLPFDEITRDGQIRRRPVDRVPAKTHVERPGIDQSIPESERREAREPGEEG